MIERHAHTGTDSLRVRYPNIEIAPNVTTTIVLKDTDAATAANYDAFFHAPWPCEVVSIKESHKTAGTDVGAVTLMIEKRTGTQTKTNGVDVLASTFNLKAAVETYQEGTMTATAANRQLSIGDKLGLETAGTLTAVAHVVVTVEVRRTF